jgi:cysteinyl-tRNA synthetase
MGVLYLDPVVWFEGRVDADMKLRIEGLLGERSAARVNKDWARADEIRAELTAMGVEVLDAAGGAATWRLKD